MNDYSDLHTFEEYVIELSFVSWTIYRRKIYSLCLQNEIIGRDEGILKMLVEDINHRQSIVDRASHRLETIFSAFLKMLSGIL